MNSAFINSLKNLKTTTKILIVGIALLLVSAIVLSFALPKTESRISTISTASLQKIIEINELSTIEYSFNAIATQMTEDGTAVKYYVAYEGVVEAGINFDEIIIEKNDSKKLITITLPEVKIHTYRVDMGTLEYIFMDDKYNTETVSQEAYRLCKSDLKNRLKNEPLLRNSAKENAISSVEALFKPWIETIDNEYTVEIQ